MLVLTNAACIGATDISGATGRQQKNFNGVFCYPYFSLDFRMNTTPAGENIFCAGCFLVLLVGKMKKKTHVKLNISLPADVHAWCIQKQKEEQRKNRMATVRLSNVIAYAIKETMDEDLKRTAALNEQLGNAEPLPHNRGVAPAPAASTTFDPSVKCAGGSSTPKTIRYQKGGRRKSST